jgi:hypothetical protein
MGNVVKDVTLKFWVPKQATRSDYGFALLSLFYNRAFDQVIRP